MVSVTAGKENTLSHPGEVSFMMDLCPYVSELG